jgi:hypothetical protein
MTPYNLCTIEKGEEQAPAKREKDTLVKDWDIGFILLNM